MLYLQPWKIPYKESTATISCYLNPYERRKITTFTTCSSSSSDSYDPSSSSSKQFLTEKSLKGEKGYHGAFFVKKESIITHGRDAEINKVFKEASKDSVKTIMAKNSSDKRQPFWRKFWFGTKKFRSIFILNVVTVVYGIHFNTFLLCF